MNVKALSFETEDRKKKKQQQLTSLTQLIALMTKGKVYFYKVSSKKTKNN